MKFHSSVIFVESIEQSKTFYTQLLSQEIEHDFGKNIIFKNGFAIWEIQQEHPIKKGLLTKGNQHSFELYFETPLIDEIYLKLTQANTRFLHTIHEEPWGQRTIRFFDPDNHLIEIGEPLETFVLNMKNNGLSTEQIVEKSGIPHDTVLKILSST